LVATSNLLGHGLRQKNVLASGGLIATHKQDNQLAAALNAIQAVSRSVIELQFQHTVGELTMLSRVAFLQAANSNVNPCPSVPIA
jgi:hypothetical protein